MDAEQWLPLVRKLAAKHGGKQPIEDSDQYSDGCFGLVKACGSYDPAKGAESTWATHYIEGYIRRGKENRGFVPPATQCDSGDNGDHARQNYLVRKAMKRWVALPDDIADNTPREDGDLSALECLTPTQLEVVCRRVFFNHAFTDIAAEKGLHRDTPRQQYARAIENMRKYYVQLGAASGVSGLGHSPQGTGCYGAGVSGQ